MLIAFEGPDKTGKSTSAIELSWNNSPIYNATKANHAEVGRGLANEPELVQTFDRIDWFTHMIYRLAMPDRDWNDDRPRTVFAMPDTHLVIKVHSEYSVDLISDELYGEGHLGPVNDAYYNGFGFLVGMNRAQDYRLFKTISLVVVDNNHSFTQKLSAMDTPTSVYTTQQNQNPITNQELLERLRHEDQHIG